MTSFYSKNAKWSTTFYVPKDLANALTRINGIHPRNVVHLNGRVYDILVLVSKADKEDPSMKEKISAIKSELLSLSCTLDYYDGEGNKELRVPTSRHKLC